MPTPAEQRILDLCNRVIAAQESENFQETMEELRFALHSHIERMRQQTRSRAIDLRLVVNNSNSSVAD